MGFFGIDCSIELAKVAALRNDTARDSSDDPADITVEARPPLPRGSTAQLLLYVMSSHVMPSATQIVSEVGVPGHS